MSFNSITSASNKTEIIPFNTLIPELKIKIFFEGNGIEGLHKLKTLDQFHFGLVKGKLGHGSTFEISAIYIQGYAENLLNPTSDQRYACPKLSALMDVNLLKIAPIKNLPKLLSKLMQTFDLPAIQCLLHHPKMNPDQSFINWVVDNQLSQLMPSLLSHPDLQNQNGFDDLFKTTFDSGNPRLITELFNSPFLDLAALLSLLPLSCEVGNQEVLDLILTHENFDLSDSLKEEILNEALNKGLQKKQEDLVITLLDRECREWPLKRLQDLMLKAAETHCLQVLQEILENPSIDVTYNDYKMFSNFGRDGSLDAILACINKKNVDPTQAILKVLAGAKGDRKNSFIVQYFLSSPLLPSEIDLTDIFVKSCMRGNLEAMQYYLLDPRVNYEKSISKALREAASGKNIDAFFSSLHHKSISHPDVRASAAQNVQAVALLLRDSRWSKLKDADVRMMLKDALAATSYNGIVSIAKLLLHHPQFEPTEILSEILQEAIKNQYDDYSLLISNYLIHIKDYNSSSARHLQKALTVAIEWLLEHDNNELLGEAFQKNEELLSFLNIDFFAAMPNEILYKIFHNLEAAPLLSIQMTNRRLKALSEVNFEDVIDKYSFVAEILRKSPKMGMMFIEKFKLDVKTLIEDFFYPQTLDFPTLDRFFKQPTIENFLYILIFCLDPNLDLLVNPTNNLRRFSLNCLDKSLIFSKMPPLRWLEKVNIEKLLKAIFQSQSLTSPEIIQRVLDLHHFLRQLKVNFSYDPGNRLEYIDLGRVLRFFHDELEFKMQHGQLPITEQPAADLLIEYKDLWVFEVVHQDHLKKFQNAEFDSTIQFFGQKPFTFLYLENRSFFKALKEYFLLNLDHNKNKQKDFFILLANLGELINQMKLSSNKFANFFQPFQSPLSLTPTFQRDATCEIIKIFYEIFYLSFDHPEAIPAINKFVNHVVSNHIDDDFSEELLNGYDFTLEQSQDYLYVVYQAFIKNATHLTFPVYMTYLDFLHSHRKVEMAVTLFQNLNKYFIADLLNPTDYQDFLHKLVEIFLQQVKLCLNKSDKAYLDYVCLIRDIITFMPPADQVKIELRIKTLNEEDLKRIENARKEEIDQQMDYFSYLSDNDSEEFDDSANEDFLSEQAGEADSDED